MLAAVKDKPAVAASYYAALGITTPNLRFHDSTYPGNVPFNFVDGWGAVVDFGVLSSSTGIVNFTSPVDYVEISALAQSAFDLNSAQPWSWTILAYDAIGNLVSSASEMFGFDFAGSPNPPNTAPYPLASLFLRVDAIDPISRIEIFGERKFGIDSMVFEPVTDVNDNAPVITTAATQKVPENTTVVAALTSTDADTVGTNPATFSITGGTDAALFDIVGGNLVFKICEGLRERSAQLSG